MTPSFRLGRAVAALLFALTFALAGLAPSSLAQAEPQGTVGLTIGAAAEGYDHQLWKRRTAFHLGLHGDVLFGRTSTADLGVGPVAVALTHGFDEIQIGGSAASSRSSSLF